MPRVPVGPFEQAEIRNVVTKAVRTYDLYRRELRERQEGRYFGIGIQILRVNRRFLPRAVRAPLWREAGLLLCVVFYAFFSWFGLQAVLRSLLE